MPMDSKENENREEWEIILDDDNAQETLFARFGGERGIRSVVFDFYHRILQDSELMSYFQGIDMDKLIEHQTTYITFAFGGPAYYSGKSLKESHQHLRITTAHYHRTLEHLTAAMRNARVSAEDIEQSISMLRALRDAVANPASDG